MAIVAAERVRLGAQASNKADAIRQVGELLVRGGCVEPGYIESMLARESTMSTYLGNGVAIPHGQYDGIELVRSTGIAVLQIPAGVEWEPGEHAYLVIGIAASSNEHVGVLANLAEVIEDEQTTAELVQASDPALIVERLSRTQPDEA